MENKNIDHYLKYRCISARSHIKEVLKRNFLKQVRSMIRCYCMSILLFNVIQTDFVNWELPPDRQFVKSQILFYILFGFHVLISS